MKILLCIPNNPRNMRIKSMSFGISPPLGAGYLASCIQNKGHTVKILDNSINNLDEQQFELYLRDFKPDIVGFTTYTFSINVCFKMAAQIKTINPDIKIVFGGPHATYLSKEVMRDENVDFIVKGEAEESIVKLLDAFSNKEGYADIKGIVYKDDFGQIIDNGNYPLIKNLDDIPLPAYNLLEMHKYYPSVNRKFSNGNFASIITSRGCPYKCTFCSHEMFGSKVRLRSPKNVVREIGILNKEYNVKEFIFLDDTFTTVQSRVFEICDLIVEKNLGIVWSCNTRADHASKELYLALNKAGCKALHIGVESGSQEALDLMKKNITLDQIQNAISLGKKYVGCVTCGFILGMPGDTIENANHTINYAISLNPDYATFTIATPIPGSELFKNAVKKGLIDTQNAEWDKFFVLFSPDFPVIEMSDIKRKDLIRLTKKAFIKFYFRPSYVFKKILSFRQLQLYARGLQTVLRYLFYKFD